MESSCTSWSRIRETQGSHDLFPRVVVYIDDTRIPIAFIHMILTAQRSVQLTEKKTRDVIAQRQSQTLLELSEEIPRARNTASYWELATEVLSRNDKDIPFALLYSAETDEGESTSSRSRFSEEHQLCTLRGSFGLPKGSCAGPKTLDFTEDHGFSPYFRQAMDARKPIMIPLDEGSPAAKLVQDVEWKGWVRFVFALFSKCATH